MRHTKRKSRKQRGGDRLPDDAEIHCFIHEQMFKNINYYERKGRHKFAQEIKLRLKILNEFIKSSPDIRLHTDVSDEQLLSLFERSTSANNLCKAVHFKMEREFVNYPEPFTFALISPTDGTILGFALCDQTDDNCVIEVLCGSKFKGVGTKLLDTVKRYASFSGFPLSLASLSTSRSFYEHYGLKYHPNIMGVFKWDPPPELARARRESNTVLVEDSDGEEEDEEADRILEAELAEARAETAKWNAKWEIKEKKWEVEREAKRKIFEKESRNLATYKNYLYSFF